MRFQFWDEETTEYVSRYLWSHYKGMKASPNLKVFQKPAAINYTDHHFGATTMLIFLKFDIRRDSENKKKQRSQYTENQILVGIAPQID